ncbi:MAG: P-loop NTPase [Acidilobaceae archaeon]|nr:P-loop NTPase [Acidilobaceae archaeon]
MDFKALYARKLLGSVRSYAVLSSKGGVGKTTAAAVLSLLLARRGLRVGLVDADLTNSTAHVVLGVEAGRASIEEGKGFRPLEVSGVKLVTPVIFTRDNPLALRGSSATEALKELLVAAEWGELDVLILDMPPGLKDEALEVMGLGARGLVISTQEPLSLYSVSKALSLFKKEGLRAVGVVENMGRGGPLLREEAERLGFRHLGVIGFDEGLSSALGRAERLLETRFAREAERMLDDILSL